MATILREQPFSAKSRTSATAKLAVWVVKQNMEYNDFPLQHNVCNRKKRSRAGDNCPPLRTDGKMSILFLTHSSEPYALASDGSREDIATSAPAASAVGPCPGK